MSPLEMAIIQKVLEIVVPLLFLSLIALVGSAAKWVWAKAGVLVETVKFNHPTLNSLINEAAQFGVIAAQQIQKAMKDHPEIYTDIQSAVWSEALYLKNYAVEAAKKQLAVNGVTGIDVDLIAAAVEKALFEKYNDPALQPPAVNPPSVG